MTEINHTPEGLYIRLGGPNTLFLEGEVPNGKPVFLHELFGTENGYAGAVRGDHDHLYTLYFMPQGEGTRGDMSIHQLGAFLFGALMEETGGPVTYYTKLPDQKQD